jgi:hypothetical protein
MGGVTKNNLEKNNLCTDFISVWWKCCIMFACQFDKKLVCAAFCLKGFVIAIVKTTVYRYNELTMSEARGWCTE